LSVNALHPNNNSESINLGGQYEYRIPGGTSLFLRIGLKGTNKISFEESVIGSSEDETRIIEVNNAEYGLTYGGGLKIKLGRNQTVKIDYGFKVMGMLGNMHQYTMGYIF
jgi:opacity protein-like surface antigen